MKRLYFAPLIILACFITVHAENRYYKTTGPDSTVKAVPYLAYMPDTIYPYRAMSTLTE